MTADDRFERLLADMLADVAPTREPDRLVPEILRAARRERRWPRWFALIKEPPMRIHSRVAVGSPAVRLVYLLILTLLLTVAVTGAVVAGASLLPGTAIVVAQDGSGTATTITDAIAIAQDGDTILVKPGTYPESIAISEDIMLRGDGDPGAVVIEFAADGPTHPLEEEPFAYGILLDDSDAQVVNITVRGHQNAAGSETGISAVIIEGGDPVIEKLDVILDGDPYPDYPHFYRRAFSITGGSSAIVRDSSWDGYTMLFGPGSSPTFEGNTIRAQRIAMWGVGDKPTIRGNTLLDGAGIVWVGPGQSGIVEDNDIVGWIGGDAGDDTIIRGNTIRQGSEPADGREGSAIGISGSGTPLVEGNEISDSPNGIDVFGFGASPQISGNTIRGSVSAAIVVDNGTAPTIDGNTFEGNATGIEVRGVTTTPVMTGNTLCGNETDLVVPDGSTVTLDGNTVCQAGASDAP